MNKSFIAGAASLISIAALSFTGCGNSQNASKIKFTSGKSLDALAVYTFDGSSAKDVSEKKNDAKLSGTASYNEGKFGKALVMNGNDVFLELPESVLDTDQITFAAWIKGEGSEFPMWARICDMGNGGDGNDLWFGFSDTHSLRLDILHPEQTASTISKKKPRTGEWFHVAFTYGDGKLCLYVNGELNREQEFSPLPKYIIEEKGAKRGIYVGKSNWSDPLFNGLMNDILIAGRCYSGDEIKEIMNNGIIPSEK